MVSAESQEEQILTDVPISDHETVLPYLVGWPRSNLAISHICDKYFSNLARPDWFLFCMLVHKAETPSVALETLSDAGAFATHTGRSTLLRVVEEARNTQWCKREVLDTLERYATYAFVLDGTDVTCGAIPSAENDP